MPGQFFQPGQLLIGDDVSRGVCGPGYTDSAGFSGHLHGVKIHPIFEFMGIGEGDVRLYRVEQPLLNAGIGVANVFRRQRQQDMLAMSITVVTTKHVEKHEEGSLTAVGQRNVFGLQAPAVFLIQQLGQGGNKLFFPLRGVVNTHQPTYVRFTGGHLHQNALNSLLDLRNVAGVTTAHHDHVLTGGHGIPEIVHQGSNAGISGEFTTESREFHDSFRSIKY